MRANFKSIRWYVLITLIMAMVAQFVYLPTVLAQPEVIKKIQFTKVKGITIQVLRRDLFKQKFEDNPLIPMTNQGVIQFARQLYTPAGREQIKEECGQPLYGALFAALSNPDISDETRNEVDNLIDANTPSLPQTYTSGHFKFYYTTNDIDPDNNVTLTEIKATAKILNDAWSDYATNFTTPKYYTTGGGCCAPRKKWIDVKVYYLGPYLLGGTASSWDYIKLDSKKVVKDTCNRQTTPVHELFHRVQYNYGYVTGTADLSWAVEGTAAWSQKYRGSHVGDWMDRMNQGLNNPDLDLIKDRSYNACHFWIYFGQYCNGEMPTIKKVWSTFKTNDNKMKDAVETTIQSCHQGASMGHIVLWWAFANFHKDMSNAMQYYDYEEDEWTRNCGGTNHGPLTEVPRTTRTLNVGSNHSINGSVASYGADYYEFSVGATVTKVEINVTATTQNFAFAIIEIKNNNYIHFQYTAAVGLKDYEYKKDYTPEQLSHIALIVVGNPNGGNYTVTAKGS